MSVLEPHLILDPLPERVNTPTLTYYYIYDCHPCNLKTPKRKMPAVVSLRLFNIKLCRDCALDLQNDLVGAIECLSEIIR